MADQGTYNALNGKEIRDLLYNNLRNKIDKLPMLSVGNSFHQLTAIGGIKLSCYPADTPVPEIEFEILVEAPEVTEENDLPIPVLRTVGDGRKAEVNIPAKELVRVNAKKV